MGGGFRHTAPLGAAVRFPHHDTRTQHHHPQTETARPAVAFLAGGVSFPGPAGGAFRPGHRDGSIAVTGGGMAGAGVPGAGDGNRRWGVARTVACPLASAASDPRPAPEDHRCRPNSITT
ncbi:hypothetical protein Stube_07250 [Streptomyces tubercidicus]|uniref:Uncharacterized protein n=1 Tax=Streptomyces tubercidicus TaxID=47759 RepID=A0A640UL91_9ACTN|nr:hypothetical protein Stube_07250 [Streptomyces tubercidicus]